MKRVRAGGGGRWLFPYMSKFENPVRVTRDLHEQISLVCTCRFPQRAILTEGFKDGHTRSQRAVVSMGGWRGEMLMELFKSQTVPQGEYVVGVGWIHQAHPNPHLQLEPFGVIRRVHEI